MTTGPQLFDAEHTLVDTAKSRQLDRALRELYPGCSWNTVRRAIRSGKVRVDGSIVDDFRFPVASGACIKVHMAAAKSRLPKLADDCIAYLDGQIVVVRKPPGIASVPDATWRRDTLAQQLGARLRRGKREVPLGIVQRLDLETSGLMVLCRTAEARRALKRQFQSRQIERSYLALVSGDAQNMVLRSHLVEHLNGKRSSTANKRIGKYACTHVELLEQLRGACLVRCKLETGRTHQIRIQLSEAGHPLLGDRRYARRRIETPAAPRVMLHAATLGFTHPTSGDSLHFEESLPTDMTAAIEALTPRPADKALAPPPAK